MPKKKILFYIEWSIKISTDCLKDENIYGRKE